MILQDPNEAGNLARVEDGGVLRITHYEIGHRYAIGLITGEIAAAAAANSAFFTLRNNPSGSKKIRLTSLHVGFTTLTAFTTPNLAGRRLAVYRGSGAEPSGGTAYAFAPKFDSTSPQSEADDLAGGDIRAATTAGLTVAGITFEANPFAVIPLTQVGSAGDHYEQDYHWTSKARSPLILQPGELIAIRNPVAMDAAGTWQLEVNISWEELENLA